MQGILDWLTSLPPAALYVVLAVTAAAENVFPPLPADTVVAFGAFLAARGRATPVGAFAATWLGNIAGAMIMYAAGRRYGATWLQRKMKRFGGAKRSAQLERLYERRGVLALFLSRFLPGVRALVPPFAGALKVPPVRALLAMGIASGIWYGAITMLAYRVGADWDALQRKMGSFSRIAAIVAGGIVLVAVVIWLVRRRRAAA